MYQLYIIIWQPGFFFSPFLIHTLYLEPKPILRQGMSRVEKIRVLWHSKSSSGVIP